MIEYAHRRIRRGYREDGVRIPNKFLRERSTLTAPFFFLPQCFTFGIMRQLFPCLL